jgi:hypothetical protein
MDKENEEKKYLIRLVVDGDTGDNYEIKKYAEYISTSCPRTKAIEDGPEEEQCNGDAKGLWLLIGGNRTPVEIIGGKKRRFPRNGKRKLTFSVTEEERSGKIRYFFENRLDYGNNLSHFKIVERYNT